MADFPLIFANSPFETFIVEELKLGVDDPEVLLQEAREKFKGSAIDLHNIQAVMRSFDRGTYSKMEKEILDRRAKEKAEQEKEKENED
jgi:hypothetical protein